MQKSGRSEFVAGLLVKFGFGRIEIANILKQEVLAVKGDQTLQIQYDNAVLEF